ncbi:hypothetical protein GGQ84_002933 [Desulfitispora alkaliphila]|uniref:hypothetical protein n=1 Tax=Desulfitispora alkaliphila TaxID=622674 RepID=UPI003D1B70F1
MQITFIQWVLQTIPETLATAALVLALAGQRLEIKKILFIGLTIAVITYATRLLPISFGVHTIIIIVCYAILLNWKYKIKFGKGVLFSLIPLIALAVLEAIFVLTYLEISGLTFEELINQPKLMVIVGWPQIVVLFLLSFVINGNKFSDSY